MSKIIVPYDIKEYVSKKNTKVITKWLALTLFIGVLLVLFGDRCFYRFGNPVKYTIYGLLLVLPFVTMKIHKLFDRTWCGTIVDIRAKYSTDSTRSFRPHLETLYLKETVTFYIETDDGKFIKMKAFENRATPNSMSQYYRVGDKVLHVGGTGFLQIKDDDSERVICVVCGTADKKDNKKCNSCGHTLEIDF